MASKLDHSVDIVLWDHDVFRADDGLLKSVVFVWVKSVLFAFTFTFKTGLHNLIHMFAGKARTGHKGCNFLFFLGLPVDKVLNIRMVDVNNYHFGCTPCGSTRLNSTGCTISNF